MNADTIQPKKVHHGRNVKRLREMLGIKQEAIAIELDITQQAVSALEQKEEIEDKTLVKIAEILHVPVEAIKNFSDEGVVNIVANTFSNSDTSIGAIANQYNFNPIEKIVELYTEKEKLYERMLEAEKEKNDSLKKLLDK